MRWIISYEEANERYWIRCLDRQGWHKPVLKPQDKPFLRQHALRHDPSAEIEDETES